MKSFIQYLLQKILGYERYLFYFAIFSIYRSRILKSDQSFQYFIQLIKKNKGSVILDVGANIGVISTILANTYSNYTIISYEPISSNFNTILKVFKLFSVKTATPNKLAIGEQSGTLELTTPIDKGAKKHGLSHVVEHGQKTDPSTIEKVKVLSLDNLIGELGNESIVAIKIDVENYEIFVLRGAKKLLTLHRPIIFIELWNNERKNECILFMETLNYQIKVFDKNQLVPYHGQISLDYFFIPNELAI